jgi:hypothetical protein
MHSTAAGYAPLAVAGGTTRRVIRYPACKSGGVYFFPPRGHVVERASRPRDTHLSRWPVAPNDGAKFCSVLQPRKRLIYELIRAHESRHCPGARPLTAAQIDFR